MLNHDMVYISRNAIKQIIGEVIADSKDLFFEESHLELKNEKNIKVFFDDDNSIIVDLKVDLVASNNAKDNIIKLQENVIFMLESLTGLKVKEVNIEVEDYR